MSFCSICFESFVNSRFKITDNSSKNNFRTEISATTCGHLFHSVCIEKWLTTPNSNRKCPSCQRTLSFNSIFKIYHDWTQEFSPSSLLQVYKEKMLHYQKLIAKLESNKEVVFLVEKERFIRGFIVICLTACLTIFLYKILLYKIFPTIYEIVSDLCIQKDKITFMFFPITAIFNTVVQKLISGFQLLVILAKNLVNAFGDILIQTTVFVFRPICVFLSLVADVLYLVYLLFKNVFQAVILVICIMVELPRIPLRYAISALKTDSESVLFNFWEKMRRLP